MNNLVPKPLTCLLIFFIAIIIVITAKMRVSAFYERETDDGFIDVRGMVRGYFSVIKNPETGIFSQDHISSGVAGLARLIIKGETAKDLGFEVNASQSLIQAPLLSGRTSTRRLPGVERSGIADESFSSRHYFHFSLDRLNVAYSYDRFDFTLGRQPINLATTFYFSPNDFFAPFAAQTFYRVYKPGVDALRVEVRIGDLSRLSLMSVLGYGTEAGSDTKWSDEPDLERTSCLGRLSAVFGDFEYGLLGGTVRDKKVIGLSAQGEVFKWLGVRAEGHYADPDSPLFDSWSEICIGIEHRWQNSLDLRFEYFHHGSGAKSVPGYGESPALVLGESIYSGREYCAFGAGYELTPLMNINITAIENMTDNSKLVSFNAVYSLSDESELSLSVGTPFGEETEGALIKTEFGSNPDTLNIEFRCYF
ncbi:MAG: hypothetical protein JW882_15970 [Deltaproteobacteria bacterium]|nr:hypothetical protein [Deltaproteobacteria bacterium]